MSDEEPGELAGGDAASVAPSADLAKRLRKDHEKKTPPRWLLVLLVVCVLVGLAAGFLKGCLDDREVTEYVNVGDDAKTFQVEVPKGVTMNETEDPTGRVPGLHCFGQRKDVLLVVLVFDGRSRQFREGNSDVDVVCKGFSSAIGMTGLELDRTGGTTRNGRVVTRYEGAGVVKGRRRDVAVEAYAPGERSWVLIGITAEGRLKSSRNIPHFFESFLTREWVDR
ncbi:MAG TPA: hypothetical protein VMY39_02990 [Planctomycetota bacterium]|nr:hypothetical protein [Planctomycetota bacterium]HUV38547.1 hypothetical protein [Planctomycetota bacterium]